MEQPEHWVNNIIEICYLKFQRNYILKTENAFKKIDAFGMLLPK